MGLLGYLRGDDLLQREEERSLPAPTAQPSLLPPYSGTPIRQVSTSNVLAIADAFACVRVLADSISTLPLKVYRRIPAGRVPAGDDSRAVQLLNRPAPGSTSVDLVSQIVTHLVVHGDAFIGKFRSDGEIVQLGLLDPTQVQVELNGRRVLYTITSGGQRSEHGPEDILHIKAMSADGLRGMSPVAQCRSALGLNENLRESSRQYFAQGSRPSGILTTPYGGTDQIERVAAAWSARHGGVENMHKVAVLTGDVSFTPIAFSADDSQFLQQRELSTREIARIFRVPAWAIDGATGDSLTYSNVQEQARALVTYSLRPWIVRIERAITNDADLCPGNTYVAFELDGLLRSDAASRSEIYTRALDPETGWMTRSEIRELEDLAPEANPPEPTNRTAPLSPAPPPPPVPVVNVDVHRDGRVTRRVVRDEQGQIQAIEEEEPAK